MKFTAFFILMLLWGSTNVMAQNKNNTVGIKGGAVHISPFGNGGNFEIYYERELKYGFFLGGNLGMSKYNDFPEEFNSYSTQMPKGVPEAIDREIMNLKGPYAGFLYEYGRQNVIYGQVYLKYQVPLKIFGNRIHSTVGWMANQSNITHFSLSSFSQDVLGNLITSYTPAYRIGNYFGYGWTLGVGLEREMVKDFILSIDAKYNMLFRYGHLEDAQRLIRVGIGKRFK